MSEPIIIPPEEIEVLDTSNGFSSSVIEQFTTMPSVAKPLVNRAQKALGKIEEMLYTAPSFINGLRAAIPQEAIQAVLTDEQKTKLASGALELLSRKDGTLMANLINPRTKKIVSTVSLEKVKLSPELNSAMADYASQMQMARIAEQIQLVQVAVEDVRQGQEHDRLATAYSCQQKLLQAMSIRNAELKSAALLRIAADAEDSRNLLMLSQEANAKFIKDQPESFWGKLVSGANPDKIDSRMNELRESLAALNMVSLVEAMTYQEMGEAAAAQISLQYYGDYIHKVYLSDGRFVERLDLIDPSPANYWSETLPTIHNMVKSLPSNNESLLIGDETDGSKEMQE